MSSTVTEGVGCWEPKWKKDVNLGVFLASSSSFCCASVEILPDEGSLFFGTSAATVAVVVVVIAVVDGAEDPNEKRDSVAFGPVWTDEVEGNESEETAGVVSDFTVVSEVLVVVAEDPNEKVGPVGFESEALPDDTEGVVPNENVGPGGLTFELAEPSEVWVKDG